MTVALFVLPVLLALFVSYGLLPVGGAQIGLNRAYCSARLLLGVFFVLIYTGSILRSDTQFCFLI